MSVRDVNVDINCSRSCNHWCPRVFKIFCCCMGKTDIEQAEKVDKIAIKRIHDCANDVSNNNNSITDSAISESDLTISDFTVLEKEKQ